MKSIKDKELLDKDIVNFLHGFGNTQADKNGYSAEFVYRPPTEEQKKSEKYKKAQELLKNEWVIYL